MTDPDCQESRPDGAAEASAASARRRPGILFSDRAWTLKLALTVVILSILCSRARREIPDVLPSVEDGILAYERTRGKPILTWATTVISVSGEGFEVDSKAGRFQVTPVVRQPLPLPGQLVTLGGRFVEPRRFEATTVRIEDGFGLKRGLNYALSSVTVLVFLFLVRRRFRIRLREGLFRSRY